MNKSNTSNFLANISGDKKLSIFKKIYWILICLLNYLLSFTNSKDPRIKLIKFRKNFKSNLINKNESPSRILSDIFWLTFPWKKTKKVLKKKNKYSRSRLWKWKIWILLKKNIKKKF